MLFHNSKPEGPITPFSSHRQSVLQQRGEELFTSDRNTRRMHLLLCGRRGVKLDAGMVLWTKSELSNTVNST